MSRPCNPSGFLDVDLGLFEFLLLGYLDERFDKRLKLLVLRKFLQVFLRKSGPRHALIFAFSYFNLHAGFIARGSQDLASQSLASVQLVSVTPGCFGEKPENQQA